LTGSHSASGTAGCPREGQDLDFCFIECNRCSFWFPGWVLLRLSNSCFKSLLR
jgi:hypothetical protein